MALIFLLLVHYFAFNSTFILNYRYYSNLQLLSLNKCLIMFSLFTLHYLLWITLFHNWISVFELVYETFSWNSTRYLYQIRKTEMKIPNNECTIFPLKFWHHATEKPLLYNFITITPRASVFTIPFR